MPEKTFRLELVTPSELAYSKEVVSVTAPGSEGHFGILPGHAPLIAFLKEGILKIQEPDKPEYLLINIQEGFLEVLNNKTVILADKVKIKTAK